MGSVLLKSDFNHSWKVSTILIKIRYTHFHENPSGASRKRGGRTHMTRRTDRSSLGAFKKLRRATKASSCPSVRPHGTTRLPPDGFSWNLIFEDFSKIQVSLNLKRIKGTSHDGPYTFLIKYHSFLLEWEIFRTKSVEKIKAHILFSITFFPKSCCLWHSVEKFCRARQAKDDNMANAHCTLHT